MFFRSSCSGRSLRPRQRLFAVFYSPAHLLPDKCVVSMRMAVGTTGVSLGEGKVDVDGVARGTEISNHRLILRCSVPFGHVEKKTNTSFFSLFSVASPDAELWKSLDVQKHRLHVDSDSAPSYFKVKITLCDCTSCMRSFCLRRSRLEMRLLHESKRLWVQV